MSSENNKQLMSEEEKLLHAYTGMTIDEYAGKIMREWQIENQRGEENEQ